MVVDTAPIVTESTITKAEIRRRVSSAAAALALKDMARLLEHLKVFVADEVLELLPDISGDTVTLLRAAVADLEIGDLHVHPQELVDALADVEFQTKPPSTRARAKK